MKRIKILEAIRQGQFGGGETHVLDLATHLDKGRFEPMVLSFTNGAMVDTLKERGISTSVIHTERAFDYRVWKKVRDYIVENKIDIVHAHGTRACSNVFWAAKNTGVPLIYTVHGWSFHQDQRFPVRQLRELSERFLTNQANKTICVSRSNEQDGLNHFKLKRSTVIYNAVNLDKFNPQNTFKDIRAELGIAPNAVVIGYIVRMTLQKDPFTMLKAMKLVCEKSPNATLLMVGDGELKEKAIQLAYELNIMDRVIFQPFRRDIPDILNAIDIYCLPSLWEGFPIGILEAMAIRKAVVASPVDGTLELVEHCKTGLLVEESNPEALSKELLKLINNPTLRVQLGQAGRRYVEQNYGIERLVEEVERLYTTLA